MQAQLAEEQARNESLRATLSKLKAPVEAEVVTQSESQIKAASKLKIIDMQETEHALLQQIEKRDMLIKHLQAEIKESTDELKTVQTEIEKERSSGKAVWETVGISTVSYRDPFHTGLSKRTPTGTRAERASPRTPSLAGISRGERHRPAPHPRRIPLSPSRAAACARRAGGYFTS